MAPQARRCFLVVVSKCLTVLITPLRHFLRMAADDFDSPSSSFSFKLDIGVMENIESPVNQTRNQIQVADSDDDFSFSAMSKQASRWCREGESVVQVS